MLSVAATIAQVLDGLGGRVPDSLNKHGVTGTACARTWWFVSLLAVLGTNPDIKSPSHPCILGYILYTCSAWVLMMVEVPRIERLPDDSLCVTRWGRAGDLLLRAGDRLIMGPDHSSDLLVLVPRGRGRPMLGRYGKRGLIADGCLVI